MTDKDEILFIALNNIADALSSIQSQVTSLDSWMCNCLNSNQRLYGSNHAYNQISMLNTQISLLSELVRNNADQVYRLRKEEA